MRNDSSTTTAGRQRPRRLVLLGLAVATVGTGGCTASDGLGSAEQAITGGSAVQHPAVGTLVVKRLGVVTTCTASLLGPRTLLTAAHCLARSSKDPLDGVQAFFWNRDGVAGSPAELNPVVAMAVHPQFRARDEAGALLENVTIDGQTFPFRVSAFDLAVAHLARAEEGGAEPVPLSPVAPLAGQPVTIYGTGVTEKERRDGDTLRAARNTIEGVGTNTFHFVGATQKDGTTCDGDSGGPTLSTVDGKDRLVGVHSLGTCTLLQEKKLWILPLGQTDLSTGFDARIDVARGWIGDQLTRVPPVAPEPPTTPAPPQGQPGAAASEGPEISVTSTDLSLDPAYTVRFRIRGSAHLRSLQVLRDGRLVWQTGPEELPGAWGVELWNLTPGPHTLKIRAADDLGRAREVSFTLRVVGGDPEEEVGGCAVTPSAPPTSQALLLLWGALLIAAMRRSGQRRARAIPSDELHRSRGDDA
ncbi:MAG: trypsin-like serine protease [Deltaproteobacteria bacterium]|nr:trypsin-like serine protease [Deltaproteobacteria bacterium]